MHETREAITLEIGKQKIFGVLHLPKGEWKAPFPAVLMCHGFGGNKSGKFRLFVRHSQRLSAMGIASFRFDFRGAGDSDGEFDETTIEQLLQDAALAYTWLEKHPLIDKERIGILGRSLGGMISVHTAAAFPKTKVIALQAPVFDARPWIEARKSGSTSAPEHQGSPLNHTFLKQFVALDTAAALQKLGSLPFFHIQSINDQVIKPYHGEQYKKVRAETKAPSQFVELSRSDHDFSDVEEQKILLTTTTEWFQKHL